MIQLSKNSKPMVGTPRLIVIGILGLIGGAVIAAEWNPLPLHPRTHLVPAAYRFPKIPGGTALRLAMVHDVLHERYLRHGDAWYAARDKTARSTIDNSRATQQQVFDAMDDVAVGLDRTGHYAEAIAVEQKKLAMLPAEPPMPDPEPRVTKAGETRGTATDDIDKFELQRIVATAGRLTPVKMHQYTTCANLGTMLVHGAMRSAMAGDAKARAQVEEGLQWIRRSIAINPGSHFGRERWQAIAIEHLLAAMDHPELLQQYDLIGDSLGDLDKSDYRLFALMAARRAFADPADVTDEDRLNIRSRIPRLGAEKEWVEIVHPEYAVPMPFDEPALGIIGMWTQGGGPSPHFALALGRLMEGIEQWEIAWNAYERAAELKDKFWPDPAVCDAMVAWCREQQKFIATKQSPGSGDVWQATMRERHVAELAWGVAYQKAYHEFEALQIAAGVPLEDPHFYDEFFKNREPIASPAGLADDFYMTDLKAKSLIDLLPCTALGGGLAALLALVTAGRTKPAKPAPKPKD